MSKAELEVALGLAEPPGPTAVESEVRGALGVLVLTGANDENALSLETLEAWPMPPSGWRPMTTCGDRDHRLGPADLLVGRRPERGARPARVEVTARRTAAAERIATLPVPTIALLNGHAVGGAIDLAHGLRLADRRAGRQAAVHPQRAGLPPAVGRDSGSGRAIAPGTALRPFATCELISVDEARQLGIVDAVVAREKLEGGGGARRQSRRAGREAVAQPRRRRRWRRDPRPRGIVRGVAGR